ncbi:MAG: GIY-YIG nuclease family protein [Peptococcaceae bacterium]|nr:GIY-YIG nuclease family protein [Peptococcaceae bacterium]
MRSETKKELAAAYRSREVVGGVFAVRNTIHGKILLEATADLQGSRNRFAFMKRTGSCYHLKLQAEWSETPPFEFEVLEELAKGPTQTDGEFKEDLETLRTLWLEKTGADNCY